MNERTELFLYLDSSKAQANPSPPLIRAINPERGESARGAAGREADERHNNRWAACAQRQSFFF